MATAVKLSSYTDPQLEREFLNIYSILNNLNDENFSQDIFGEWTAYTPVWTAATADPSIGNGTIRGRYKRYGNTVDYTIYVVMGGTTTYGTGQWRFTLPFTSANPTATVEYHLGRGSADDTGTAIHLLICPVGPNATYISPNHVNVIGAGPQVGINTVDATNPFTWASTDILRLSGTYEAVKR